MYKVLYDMKSDLNDLKQFVLAMAEANQLKTDVSVGHDRLLQEDRALPATTETARTSVQPILIDQADNYSDNTVEENLSLADKEKELIEKALKKHKGKRKDAALDLGISERTLYRKIKEYEMD
jgi:DNA-binding NtrC family response regulator